MSGGPRHDCERQCRDLFAARTFAGKVARDAFGSYIDRNASRSRVNKNVLVAKWSGGTRQKGTRSERTTTAHHERRTTTGANATPRRGRQARSRESEPSGLRSATATRPVGVSPGRRGQLAPTRRAAPLLTPARWPRRRTPSSHEFVGSGLPRTARSAGAVGWARSGFRKTPDGDRTPPHGQTSTTPAPARPDQHNTRPRTPGPAARPPPDGQTSTTPAPERPDQRKTRLLGT